MIVLTISIQRSDTMQQHCGRFKFCELAGNYVGGIVERYGNYSIAGDGVGDTQVLMCRTVTLIISHTTNTGLGHTQCISIDEDTALTSDIVCSEDEAVYIAADNILLTVTVTQFVVLER